MTTLPSFLFDNYKRYKEDTNRVATWLAETAQKHGHPLKDQIPTPRPPGRLKGKYRKLAREAANATKETVAATRCTITAREFTDLADWIANLKPPVKVPRLILSCIRSAVTLRKRCSEWFQKNRAEEELMPDDLSHSHFICVLEH